MSMEIENIISTLKYELENFETNVVGEKYGRVIESGDGLVKVYGLNTSFIGELVKFENDLLGMVMKIDPETISIVVLKDIYKIVQGLKVFATGEPINIKITKNLLGRVIDPLGNHLDELLPIDYSDSVKRPLEAESPGVMLRESVCDPLQTGICLIDLFNPIGLGQKQLILGDRQTGKTSICVDIMLNQASIKNAGEKFTYCIYVAIGKKASEIARLRELLKNKGALEYSIIIATTASDSAAMQYIAPMAGVAIAEYIRDSKKDALVILDDLSKHAVAYREICLLMRRTPSREAYPGDVFFLHSRLLERAVKLKAGGSVTILPIVETLDGDVSAYIPTNIISITDGQLYLDKSLFYSGQRPAINIGLSVSRIGSAAQHKNIKQLAGSLKGQLSQYTELKMFAKSVGEMDHDSQRTIMRGDKLMEIFKQPVFGPLSKSHMILILLCNKINLLDDVSHIQDFSNKLFKYFKNYHSRFFPFFIENEALSDDLVSEIIVVLKEFKVFYHKNILENL